MTTYLIVSNSSLHMPSMSNNLIPPFVMRGSGLVVNEIVKINAEVPTKEHHSIYDATLEFRIPLVLKGMFSYFNTRSRKNMK